MGERRLNIVFLFYDGMTTLDAIGPHEVLTRLPDVSVHCVSEEAGPVRTGSGLTLVTQASLADIRQADIVLVPGACNATSLQHRPRVLEWLRMIHENSLWTTSVCTGSLILGAAGLLSGLPATTHWAVMDRLSHWGAVPTQKRVVEAGKVMTAAGVSAGIDMALVLAERLAGRETAQRLQLGIEYDPAPPFDCGSPARAAPEMVEALRARLLIKFEPGP
ncbi:DJ-1/PfpI family protein [Legionella sp. CNM-4043-24]|uniref:DJ-1/PfpI family protein n=1 Tax=Legionella sp. CNM-4043-24 TaxID=3421646 RepID=UPI00403AF1E8